jgi:hypothetical protein
MKTMNRMKQTTILASALLLTLVACKKNDMPGINDDANFSVAAVADAETDIALDDVYDNVMGDDEFGSGGNFGVFGTAAQGHNDNSLDITNSPVNIDSANRCFTKTVSPLTPGVWPKTVTVDFGTSGCVGRDGRTRYGKIITVYTNRMFVTGASATTSFDNYRVDSFKVEGEHKVTNQSTLGAPKWAVKVTNGKVSNTNNSNYRLRNADHVLAQTEGLLTPNPLDDALSITGAASGTASKNGVTVQWTRNIQEPLIKRFTCRWVSKGKIAITRNNLTGVLDYGNGTCDNTATLTIAGQTFTINLR